jgi:V8-like Glu-specific endopeptidase
VPKKAEAPATDFWAYRKDLYDCHEDCVESRWVWNKTLFQTIEVFPFSSGALFLFQEVVKCDSL